MRRTCKESCSAPGRFSTSSPHAASKFDLARRLRQRMRLRRRTMREEDGPVRLDLTRTKEGQRAPRNSEYRRETRQPGAPECKYRQTIQNRQRNPSQRLGGHNRNHLQVIGSGAASCALFGIAHWAMRLAAACCHQHRRVCDHSGGCHQKDDHYRYSCDNLAHLTPVCIAPARGRSSPPRPEVPNGKTLVSHF